MKLWIYENHICELRSEKLNEGWPSQLYTQLLQSRKEKKNIRNNAATMLQRFVELKIVFVIFSCNITLSKDVFERRTSTRSEAFFLFICLGANKFVLLSFFSLTKTIYSRVSTKPLPNDVKSSLPVDVRRSRTLFLKLPIKQWTRQPWHGPFECG